MYIARLMALRIWLVLTIGLGCVPMARAETFRVAFYDYAPMMMSASKTGIYHDIFELLGHLTGETFDIQYYPYARSKAMFEHGEIDIEAGISPVWTQDLPVPGLFTIPFGKSVDIIVFAPGKRFEAKRPADLRGKSLGAVRGYFYPGFMELFASRDIVRIDSVDEKQLLANMAKGRFDQAIINRTIAQFWIKEAPAYHRFEIGEVVGDVEISLRIHPSKVSLVPRLNSAIKTMKQSGEIDRIYAKYR